MYGTDPGDSFADQTLRDMLMFARAAQAKLPAGTSVDDAVVPGETDQRQRTPSDMQTPLAPPSDPVTRLEVRTQEPIGEEEREQTPLPDLLFVHDAWHGAWCWARVQAHCAQAGLRSHAVNLRGHGGSSGHEQLAQVHLDDYVADVAQVATELRAPCILVGHGLGGVVVQRYLSLIEQGQELSRPVGVALLATGLPSDIVRAKRTPQISRNYGGFLRRLAMTGQMRLTGDTTPLIATPELVRSWFFTFDTPTQAVMECFIQLQNESITALRDLRGLARGWQPPRACGVPVLVLGGAQDAYCDPVVLKRLADAYDATVQIFVHMGHDLMLDYGWERVADVITEWVRALPVTAATEDVPDDSAEQPQQIVPPHRLQVLDGSPYEVSAMTSARLRSNAAPQRGGHQRPESIH